MCLSLPWLLRRPLVIIVNSFVAGWILEESEVLCLSRSPYVVVLFDVLNLLHEICCI